MTLVQSVKEPKNISVREKESMKDGTGEEVGTVKTKSVETRREDKREMQYIHMAVVEKCNGQLKKYECQKERMEEEIRKEEKKHHQNKKEKKKKVKIILFSWKI